MNDISFTFSDLVAGTVQSYDKARKRIVLQTPGGSLVEIRLTPTTFAEYTRNLGDPYQDAGGQLDALLTPGNYLFAYGIYYPDARGNRFEAKHLVFPAVAPEEFLFEQPGWWVEQCRQLAEFYLNAQFEGDAVDYANYRTSLFLNGQKLASTLQETDTISRTVYGFASAYLLTGDERYYEAAVKGTDYLRKNLCKRDREDEGVVYWLHALDAQGGDFEEVAGSLFGDDYGAMPCYEQIYALAGPVQTYRITGDPEILADADKTIRLFDKYYRDKGPDGGFFSHITPETFDAQAPELEHNQARKNWNSVGDHAPAYLINLYLATGDERYLTFLEETFDTICRRFPASDGAPFVHEKFFKDWTPDKTWGWQQDRAVVGHDLKIAWNLMRFNSAVPKSAYTALAEQLARSMATVGMDPQRGGCYDVMERQLAAGEAVRRLAFHDRKAWWQQEQAILAYLILNGITRKPEYLKRARETAAFYNAWFLDNDSGAVYFNVLANGIPYLLGNERTKGSHSMGAYHATELCYLAAVYTQLLVRGNTLDLYFKPYLGALPNNTLRVAPDMLPAGSVEIASATINGVPWRHFDAKALTVALPQPGNLSTEHRLTRARAGGSHTHAAREQVKVRVTLRATR